MKKGTYGYIKKKKTFQICLTIALLCIGIIIYIAGYYLNKEEKNNIFTIISVLMMLPAAKAFTSFIVVAPFKTPDPDRYKELESNIPDNGVLLSDLVLTSAEKVMNLDFLVLMEDTVIAVTGKSKQDFKYIEEYLSTELKKQDYHCHVKIFDDYKSFFNRIHTIEKKPYDKSVLDSMKAYILTYEI